MSRYIDADEFGRCLQNYRPYVDSGRFNAIQTEINQVLDCIEYEIEDAPSIEAVPMEYHDKVCEEMARRHQAEILELTSDRPQGEFTKREYEQLLHGISLSLLSKRSAQYWGYEEETAQKIRWLEALEQKVRAKMEGADDE